MEDKGFKIFFESLPSDVSGFSAYSPDFGAAVIINWNHPREQQIFTVLHEMGHLVIHRNEYSTSGDSVLPTQKIWSSLEAQKVGIPVNHLIGGNLWNILMWSDWQVQSLLRYNPTIAASVKPVSQSVHVCVLRHIGDRVHGSFVYFSGDGRQWQNPMRYRHCRPVGSTPCSNTMIQTG